jgi:hypothetical protein
MPDPPLSRALRPNEFPVRKLFEEAVADLPARISASQSDLNALGALVSTALQAAKCGAALGHSPEQIFAHLQLAADGNTAIFVAATAKAFPVTAWLGDDEAVYDLAPHASLPHVTRWLNGIFLALLCRDEESFHRLLEVTPDIWRRSTSGFPEHEYLFAEAVHATLRGRKDTADMMIAAMEATDPKKHPMPRSAAEMTLAISVPAIHGFWCAVAKNATKTFDEALTLAIVKHKEYWEKQTWPDAFRGLLSINLLGIAALAHDRGEKFDVDSDYVPMSLVCGEGLGLKGS